MRCNVLTELVPGQARGLESTQVHVRGVLSSVSEQHISDWQPR